MAMSLIRVWINTAVLCFAFATPSLPQVSEFIDQIIAPASSSSIRKTEAAIVALKDGRLLLGFSDFYTVSPNDDAPARILGRFSSDLGKTWGPAFTLVEPDPRAALRRARERAGPGGVVLATGSIYLVADLLRPAGQARASTL